MRDADREGLVNLIGHLASELPGIRAKRLFVGLYLMDVMHFQVAGRGLTGLSYRAGDYAPYPPRLADEIQDRLHPDLAAMISVVHSPGFARYDEIFTTGRPNVEDHFSPIEMSHLPHAVDMLRGGDLERELAAAVDNGAYFRARRLGKHEEVRMEDTVALDASHRAAVLEQSLEYRKRSEMLRRRAA